MDFHALPRRDLQALCKRNSIRANMANAAMADALAALPAVDGIEEYIKPEQEKTLHLGRCVTREDGDLKREDHAPARGVRGRGASRCARPEPPATRRRGAGKKTDAAAAVDAAAGEEKQGIQIPRGFKSPEPVMPEDGDKSYGDLKRDENEAALDAGRRGAGRRTSKTEAPATKRSKTESGVVAVPARTTRGRSQRSQEEVRMTTRAAARKDNFQQEEEGEGPEGVISDAEITAPTPEGRGDPEQAVDPLNEESNQVVEESGQECQADTVPGAAIDTPILVEEDPAEECTDILQAVKERHQDVQQCAAPLPNQEDSPTPVVLYLAEQGEEGVRSDDGPLYKEISHSTEGMELVPISEAPQDTLTSREATQEVGFTGDASRTSEEDELANFGQVNANEAGTEEKEDAVRKDNFQQEEEGEGPEGVISDAEISAPAPEGRGDPEQALDPLNEESNQVVEESGQECQADTVPGAATDTPILVEEDPAEECTDILQAVKERHQDVQQCAAPLPNQEDSPTLVVLCLAEQGEEGVRSDDGPLYKEINHSIEDMELVPISEAPQDTLTSRESTQEVGFTGDASHNREEDEVANFSQVNANEAGTEEKEDVTVVGVPHDTDEASMVDLSRNISPAVVDEEEVVVATETMPESSETKKEGTADNVSQVVTVTEGQDAGKENADEAGSEEKEDVVVIEVLHDTVAGFDESIMADLSSNISPFVVEEVVVATENMPESFDTMKEGVEEMVTPDNLSQVVTVTDGKDAGKESAFTGDLPSPPVFHTSRDFNDHITSPLSAGMLGSASLFVDSTIIVEPTMAENQDVSGCTYSNSGGEKMDKMPRDKGVQAVVTVTDDEHAGKKSTFSSDLPPVLDTSRDYSDVSLCMYNDSGSEKNVNEPVAAEQGKEVEEGEESPALGEPSLRKLRMKFKETSRDCSDMSLCVYNDSGREKNVNEPVAAEQGMEVREGEEYPALGELSLRKLRMKLKETMVAVEQEKESNKSMALKNLSLRKLKIKLKEALAQQPKEKRVALGRLDENVC